MTTKEIGVDVLLSVTSGRMLCDNFGQVQEVGDFLTGESTYTHMYASKSLWERLKSEINRQFPWTADEDKVFADYPDLYQFRGDDRSARVREALDNWFENHVYLKYGRTVTIEPEPEPVHIPFDTGLENLGKGR